MPSKKLIISGKVQGVGYRRWFAHQATKLGLKGYVKNLAHGDVEAMIVGEDLYLAEMIRYSQQGPFAAEVRHIQITDLSTTHGYTNFQIQP